MKGRTYQQQNVYLSQRNAQNQTDCNSIQDVIQEETQQDVEIKKYLEVQTTK